MRAVENNNKRLSTALIISLAMSGQLLPVSSKAELQQKPLENNIQYNRVRQKPGQIKQQKDIENEYDPNGKTGLKAVAPPRGDSSDSFIPISDRWRLAEAVGIKESWLDPYNRNLLKADRPMFDDWFASLSIISDSVFEYRKIPTPVGSQTTLDRGSLDVFGRQDQFLFNQNLILGLVIYKGDTVFRPPDFEFRFTPVINYNYTTTEEDRVLNIDPQHGTDRSDGHFGIQDLFVDFHIRNVSDRYDFDSIRLGIQPITNDFRGFLFQDNQLGVRLFGNRDNNLWQYNLAWFRRLEKDTNSGLNDLSENLRDDDVFLANLYRQDFPVKGFTSQISAVYNRNSEGKEDAFYDQNGFLVRPASIGNEYGRDYDAYYVGYNGDGHFGRLNLSVSSYYLFGRESQGLFNESSTDINAYFFAGEASIDFDWVRLRLSGLFATGDEDPYDNESEGYDAIFENPLFAGADSSFWLRQAVPLIGGGGVALSGRNGILNSMRSSKEQGQSNFTNPGLILVGLGADLDVLPELRISGNFNKLFFDETRVLEVARNQGDIDKDIGWDLSLSTTYRPFFSQNVIFRLSGAMLIPGDGLKDLYGNKTLYSVLGNIVLTY